MKKIEERKKEKPVERDKNERFRELRLYKNWVNWADPTSGRPPGRLAQTESKLGFSRSTDFRLNFFLNSRLDRSTARSTGPMTG